MNNVTRIHRSTATRSKDIADYALYLGGIGIDNDRDAHSAARYYLRRALARLESLPAQQRRAS